MERIRLGKHEKTVLRMVAGGQGVCPAEYPSHTFNAAVRSLDGKGLVRGAYEEGGKVVDAMMTQVGRQYLAENSALRNPVDWKWVITTVLTVIGTAVAIVALLVACSK